MPSYQIRIHDRSGSVLAVTDRFRNLTVEHRVNHVSTLMLAFAGDEPITRYVDEQDANLDNIIEIRRTVPEAGLDWYSEYVGLHRTAQRQVTSEDLYILTSYSRGLLDLINRRSIRYYADTDGSAKGPLPADDVIKIYVDENAGPFATTANNRVTNGVIPGLTVAPSQLAAPTYEGAHAWKNLLTAIREIGEANSVDFDVAWLGGASFEFRTLYPRLGTDRRAGVSLVPMIFSPEFGNMTNPSHTRSRTEEATSALVLGPGEGPLRDTTLRTNAVAAGHSPWNLIEIDVDQSNEDRQLALEKAGDSALHGRRATVSFTFDVIQTPLATYRRHYGLGDFVTAAFKGVSGDLKIRSVTLNVSQNAEAGNAESVRLELEEVS